MTCRRAMPSTLAMVAALALAPPAVLGARQQTTGGQRGQASTGPSKPAQKVPPKARTTGGIPQGFSVVLVVGDLQGAPGDGDVPPAARQALNDMKDFLPYKSYKLLDAAWIMSGYSRATTRLRGPEEREFEIEIAAQPVAGMKDSAKEDSDASQRIYVQFSLRDAVPDLDELQPTRGNPREQALREQLSEAEAQLKAARERDRPDNPEVRRLEQTVTELRNKLAASTRVPTRSGLAQNLGPRTMMNTSFTMDVGETVVVGTSRLRSNSKALIALLTAVPQRGSSRKAATPRTE